MPDVKSQMSKKFWNFSFDIHLTFACLREAASAKAGILIFGFIKDRDAKDHFF
jgi:hypothetical protein